MTITLSPRICQRLLAINAVALTLLGLSLELLRAAVDEHALLALYPIVSLHHEHNLPTWYLTGLFGMVALLCALHGERSLGLTRRAWRALALTFLLISLQAAADPGALMAGLVDEVRRAMPPAGAFAGQNLALFVLAGALIAAGLAALVLSVLAIFFLSALPRALLIAAALAGLAFAAAHLGREAQLPFTLWYGLGGGEPHQAAVERLWQVLLGALEIAGASLLCAGMVGSLAAGTGRLHLTVVPGQAAPEAR